MNFADNEYINNHNIFIELTPKRQDVKEILFWLKKEYENDGASFYSNRSIIESSFQRGNLIVFKHGEKSVGAVIWSSDEKLRVDIDIFVIHPDYRGQGYGSLFYKNTSDFFRGEGFKVVKLFCMPIESESFWIKMGLIAFPDCGQTEHPLTYYEILVETASTAYIGGLDKIELWDVEPYEANNVNPKWTWYLEKQDGLLLYPIIQPCNCNWNLCWSRNGIVIREEKVKYFTDIDFEVYCSQFLYINELRE